MVDLKRFLTKRAIVWLVIGLLGGGLATELWEGRRAGELEQRLAEQQRRLGQDEARARELGAKLEQAEARLRDAERRLKESDERLAAERRLRHKYEEALNQGRK